MNLKQVSIPIAGALLAAGCTLAGDITPPPGAVLTNPDPTIPQPEGTAGPLQIPDRMPDIENGEQIYADRCEPCHGPGGLGDGSQAADLPNEPALLGAPELARSAVPGSWFEIVTNGRLDRFMPGFASLTDLERWDVVGYSLTLSVDPALIDQAQSTFSNECAGCHGLHGEGSGQGPALAEADLFAENSRADLFSVISDGAPPNMPAYREGLGEELRWALAAHVQTLRGGQAAAAAEEPQAEVEAGRVAGQVVNGTPGQAAPQGLEVTLHGFDGQQEVVTLTAQTGLDGEYQFDDLELEPGRLFIVSTDYQGVRYASEVLHLESGESALELPVTIFESTNSLDAVRVDQIHVLLDYPEPDQIRLVELWVIRNLGDRTIAASSEGGGIEIPLPDNVENLRFEDSMFAERYEAVPGGFAYRPPLRPGNEGIQIVFSFDLPYPRSLVFSQEIPYSVGKVTILAPESGPRVTAEQLLDRGPRQVSDQVVHQYDLELDDGEPLEFEIRGRAPGDTFLPEWLDLGVLIGAGALLAVVAGLGLWLRPWEPREGLWQEDEQKPRVEYPANERQRLVAMIAELDEAFEAGDLEQSEYRSRRKSLKDELIERMREGNGE